MKRIFLLHSHLRLSVATGLAARNDVEYYYPAKTASISIGPAKGADLCDTEKKGEIFT